MKNYNTLVSLAQRLVTERIKGHRKGLPEVPTHEHSFRVYEIIKKQDDMSNDARLAALLHDIVEDGGVTYEELADAGFSQRTIELVRLCSHSETDMGKEARWTLMIAKLIEAKDREAWAIKIADLLDNLKESRGLAFENRHFMVEVKAKLMLRLTARLFADHPLWSELMKEVDIQRRDMYKEPSGGNEEK